MRVRLPYRLAGSFKGLLFVLAVATILAVMVYTESMVSDLRESSRRFLTLKVERFRMLLVDEDNAALDAYLSEMAAKDFPLIVTDSTRTPTSWSGLPELDELPRKTALKRAEHYKGEWLRQGNEPVPIEIPEYGLKFYFYYGDSEQIRRLRMMPWIEVAVVGSLILIGYLGFLSIKKSEERSVWVGMARETAHQLGTPLTSLYGWMELLKERPDDSNVREEIVNDLKRLTIVADRFNKIGSRTPLKSEPLLPIIEEAVIYIKRRLPQSKDSQVSLKFDIDEDLSILVNHTLFEWALENLLKNGVEALKGQSGYVNLTVSRSASKINIDVKDSGCGIPRRQWRNVFRPGYSTKERGWGLGLSLTRRIIEDVHRGRIFVVSSNQDKGTLIRVQLPV
ncbi:MAG: HAMP domain-containing sensor histidine kinase [Candidatus Hatepunaea meridiana]|nr:HAMP domain-containing sensor histidine kinase [Candidatus Hatepunaea meridiana]